eukprot:c13161_g6_i2.p1 GENE.c13161_g6_i2~~c13161_g6_i2.p1  ORF type:complete len:1010 (+),score=316.65 c13161_g6_i2:78-3032(+)
MAGNNDQVQGVANVFRATGTADNDIRNAAEQQLKIFEHQPGFLPVVLQVILNAGIEPEVRQTAAIHAKNTIRKRWKPSSEAAAADSSIQPLLEDEKVVLKDNIVEAVLFTHNSTRVQVALLESLRLMVYHDFPEKWPTLLPAIQNGFSSQDITRVHGCLLCLHAVLVKFQYMHSESRQVQYQMAEVYLPGLLQVMRQCLTSDSSQAAHMARAVAKIFWSCAAMHTAPYLLQPAVFSEWITEIIRLFSKQVAHTVEAGELVDRSPWWRARKWGSKICLRMFEKYGQAKSVPEHKDEVRNKMLKDFASWFEKNLSVPLLTVTLSVLREGKNGGMLTKRIQTNCLNHLTLAIGQSVLFKTIRNDVMEILTQLIFPLLCHSANDEQLFQNDPEEYIRRQTDEEENFYDERLAALSLIERLCTLRRKHTLQPLLVFLEPILANATHHPTDPHAASLKSGALRAIGALASLIEENFPNQIEPMVAAHVVPDLASPFPFLKSIACWVLTTFSDLKFEHCGGINHVMTFVAACMDDDCLIVRYEACKNIRHILNLSGAQDAIRPYLEKILNRTFEIMNELNSSEELMDTIEKVLSVFDQDIAPQCVMICKRLVDEFQRLFVPGSDDDEAAMTCLGIINTWQTLIFAARENEAFANEIENLIVPCLIAAIHNESMEFIDNVLDVVSSLTLQRTTVSPTVWSLVPVLQQAFETYAMDYAEAMLVPLDNMITNAPNVFACSTNPDYSAMIFSMCAKAFAAATPSNCFEAQQMAKLLECGFQNTRAFSPHMLRWRRPALELISTTVIRLLGDQRELSKKLSPTVVNFVLLCVNAMAAVVYSDAEGFVGWLDEVVFDHMRVLWQLGIGHLPRTYDKKASAVALMTLMAVPAENLPFLQPIRPQLFQNLLGLLQLLAVQIEQEKQADGEGEKGVSKKKDDGDDSVDDSDDDDDDDDDIGARELSDNEDINNEKDMAYLAKLQAVHTQKQQTKQQITIK